jgi:hypothetical protein
MNVCKVTDCIYRGRNGVCNKGKVNIDYDGYCESFEPFKRLIERRPEVKGKPKDR